MGEEDDTTRDEAPDLKIFGDEVTFQPSTVESAKKEEGGGAEEAALMKHDKRFRREPLQFLREVSIYVSGQGWRAYDNVIGQPIFYSGFSENMKSTVMSAPMLQQRIAELAERQVEREEKQGWFRKGDADYDVKRARRRSEFEGWLRETAEVWTDKMICKLESKPFIRSAYYLVASLLTRAYHQGIHVATEDIVMLRETAERAARAKQSIVFLPCHRSHVDYVALQLICYRLGIGLPIVVAGDNLNFPLVGSFLQHAGAMYIRRSFGDDMLYSALVQAYIDSLLQGGFNVECFIEGGRSRTGKLLSPKFGILSFILDSLLCGRVEDAIIIPVSTQYDKVIETEGYVGELLGIPKTKESLWDFLTNGSSVLSLRLGRIDLRFHEPWSLRGFMDEQLTRLVGKPSVPDRDIKAEVGSLIRQKILRTLGYKVLSDINDVSVVMPTALVGTVLLTLRGRGVGIFELVRRVEWLTQRIKAKGGRVAHFGGAPMASVIERAIEVLGKDLVGKIDDLAEPVYFAVDRFQLSFYRNMTIHLFILEALVSAGMYTRVKLGGGPAIQDIPLEDLRAQISFLSTLFRGEFIFPGTGLEVNLDKTLRGLEADQVIRLQRGSDGSIIKVGLSDRERTIGRENYDFYCFLIWPFIEASWLAAVSLFGLTPPADVKEDIWVEVSKAQNSAQFLGKSLYQEGDLSYFEAVNKETLKNAYQRFQEEGIITVVKSKDAKVPARLRLSPDWTPSRDPTTGKLVPSGRLWDFADKIASSRREGKNRRDGATVSTRVLRLADLVGRRLFDEAVKAGLKGGAPVSLTEEEKASLGKTDKTERRRGTVDEKARL